MITAQAIVIFLLGALTAAFLLIGFLSVLVLRRALRKVREIGVQSELARHARAEDAKRGA